MSDDHISVFNLFGKVVPTLKVKKDIIVDLFKLKKPYKSIN